MGSKKEKSAKADSQKKSGFSLLFKFFALLIPFLSFLYYKNRGAQIFSNSNVSKDAFSEGQNFYSFSAQDIDKKKVDFGEFKNKVVLAVNVASECGYTSQYAGLQKLYENYKHKGFVVIGFPSDQFSQELDTEEEIKSFCSKNYQITFPLMSKILLNGEKAHPVYKFLTKSKTGILGLELVKWNFEKFLIDKRGEVVYRYSSATEPEEITKDIEKLLF